MSKGRKTQREETWIVLLALVLIATVALQGCGSGDGVGEATPQTSPTPSASASVTGTDVPSEQSTLAADDSRGASRSRPAASAERPP